MKTLLNYILTIVLTVLILALFFINLINHTVLSKQYVLSELENQNYYSKILVEVKSNFQNYIYQSGLDEDVLEDIVTEKNIRNDTVHIIDNLYNGLNKEIELETIKENLSRNIHNQLKVKNITNVKNEAIDAFIEHICNEYKTTISYFSFEGKVGTTTTKLIEYIALTKKILLIIIAIDFLLLFVLNLKGTHKFFSLIGIALTSSGLFLIFTNIFINIRIRIGFITILNDTISEILRTILNRIIYIVLEYGILFTIIGVLIVIISNTMHYKNINKANEE